MAAVMEEPADACDREEVDQAVLDQAVKTLALLEDFCSSPDFTTAVQEFIAAHADSFEATEEQRHEDFAKFKQYCALIEGLVERFLQDQGVAQTDMVRYCELMRSFDCSALMCVDYLLAAFEYEEFLALMLDHKALMNWQPAEPDA